MLCAVTMPAPNAAALLRRDAAKPGYQLRTTGAGESQYEMLKKLRRRKWASQMILACLHKPSLSLGAG